MTDDASRITDLERRIADLEARLDRAQGVAMGFQHGTIGWIRRRGLDFDDYCAYLASISWSTTRAPVGGRRMADVMAAQISAPGAFSATVSGDDAEARIELVGPDLEALPFGPVSADDLWREIELVFAPVAERLGHDFEAEAGDGSGRIVIRPRVASR